MRNIVSFAAFGRGLMKGAPGMLLEHVVNVLQARDVTLANTIHSLVQPADRRTERDAVITNFAAGFQFLEGLPEGIVIDLFHPDVVQLEKIDPVCFQPLERCVRCARNRFRRKILGNFALPASARLTVMHKIVADLGRDHDFIPLVRETPWRSILRSIRFRTCRQRRTA